MSSLSSVCGIAKTARTLPPARYVPAFVKLLTLDDLYAVVRLDPDSDLPDWLRVGNFWSATRTDSELSLVCREADVPAEASAERGWCALEVAGPLDFSLTGVVASLCSPLADAEVPTCTARSRRSPQRATRSTVDAPPPAAYAGRDDSFLHLVGLALRAVREPALR